MEEVIVIHGQGNDTHICLAKMSPQYSGLKVVANLPYLSLYMNVMDKGKRVKGAQWVDPHHIEATVKSSNYKPIRKALGKEQASSEQPRAGFTDTDGQEGPAEVTGTVKSDPNFVEGGGRKRENPTLQDIEGGQKKQKLAVEDIDEGAVEAWKAWLEAERDLQTIIVVKDLNSFKLNDPLKHFIRAIVTASKNPFLSVIYTHENWVLIKSIPCLRKVKMQRCSVQLMGALLR